VNQIKYRLGAPPCWFRCLSRLYRPASQWYFDDEPPIWCAHWYFNNLAPPRLSLTIDIWNMHQKEQCLHHINDPSSNNIGPWRKLRPNKLLETPYMELGKAFLGYWECIHRKQPGKIHTAFKIALIPSWLRLGLIWREFELSLNETAFELNFKFESNVDLFKFELTDLFELKLTPPFSKVNWIELSLNKWTCIQMRTALSTSTSPGI
jgi:hypothetical protein